MHLLLSAEVEAFIDAMIKSGRFSTPEAVIEAAIKEMRFADELSLSDEVVAAISEADAQADRDEGTELDAFRARFNRRCR